MSGFSINFWQCFEQADCCISDVRAFRVYNRTYHTYENCMTEGRSDCALTYVLEGAYRYKAQTGDFTCGRGEMSFLSRGACYSHENIPPSRMYVVYFTLRTPDGLPFHPGEPFAQKLLCRDPVRFERLFFDIINRYFSVLRSVSDVKAALYRLTSALAREESQTKLDEGDLSRIHPAIEFLTVGNIDDEAYQSLTVSKLAKMCALSEYTFRELFKKYAGVTPKAYIDEHRIEQVEALLSVTDITITDAAVACGFEDPSYFFKMYRRIRGRPPGER